VEANGERALDALGDATRRKVFRLVALQPRSVGEIAGELPVSRPAVSQHLKVLKDAGLVVDHADGTRRVYRVNAEARQDLHAYLDGFWADALAAFKALAEQPDQPEGKNKKGKKP
jgi:DNA-binding transcriptional ArsR family regulator